MQIITIAFLASVPLFVLYLAGIGLQRKASSDFSQNDVLLDRHLKATLFLSVSTIVVWLNHRIAGQIDNGVLILATAAAAFGLFATRNRIIARETWGPIIIGYALLFLCCLLNASVYAIVSIPDTSHFIPAVGNNDVFAYLFRSSALFDALSERVALEVSGTTPEAALRKTSKFASAYFLTFFMWLTENHGQAAAGAVVAGKTAILHLLWSAYRVPGARVSSIPWILFLASAPSVVLLSLLFHLSQLGFVYLCLLTAVVSRKIIGGDWASTLTISAILLGFALLLYPSAFPLYLAVFYLATLRCNYKAVPWRKLAAIFAIAIFGAVALWRTDISGTDFREHLTADYYSVGYYPILGQWLSPLALGVFSWRGLNPLLQQTVGVVLDLAFFGSLLYACRARLSLKMNSGLALALIALGLAWLVYEAIFFATSGNYRAFKVHTILVTVAALAATGLLYREWLARHSRQALSMFTLLALGNFATLAFVDLDRSVPPAFDDWLDFVKTSDHSSVFFRFDEYRLNMYFPLALPGRKLYPLTSSYFQAVNLGDVCRCQDPKEAVVFVTKGQPSPIPGNIIREFPGGVLAVAPTACSDR